MAENELHVLARERGIAAGLLRNEPLSSHTSYGIGGPADYFTVVKTQDQLCRWVKLAREVNRPCLVIGRGTNLLVADEGFRGVVIENRCQDFALDSKSQILHAEAGAPITLLARKSAKSGSQGLEWAVGIPGTIGGAVVNNAGAYNGAIADVVCRVTILDQHGEVQEVAAEKLRLSYRTSRFREQESRGEVILSAELLLSPESPQLLSDRVARYDALRRAAQPPEPSAGSVFKNPPGLSAAQLIEQAGLKGRRVGNAQISSKHANYIVNLRSAKATDVLQLIKLVKEEVHQVYDVKLELEIELVGEWALT
jgi:UDP-N-acetylmuramate dehydrogenase